MDNGKREDEHFRLSPKFQVEFTGDLNVVSD